MKKYSICVDFLRDGEEECVCLLESPYFCSAQEALEWLHSINFNKNKDEIGGTLENLAMEYDENDNFIDSWVIYD